MHAFAEGVGIGIVHFHGGFGIESTTYDLSLDSIDLVQTAPRDMDDVDHQMPLGSTNAIHWALNTTIPRRGGCQRRRCFHLGMVWQSKHQEISFLRRRRNPLRLKGVDTRQPVCKHRDSDAGCERGLGAHVVGDAVFDIATDGHDIATAI